MKAKKFLALICSTLVLGTSGMASIAASAVTEQVEYGASWYHDAYFSWGGKKAVSNLASSSRWHNSSCRVGSDWGESGDTQPGVQSESSAWGMTWSDADAYYNIW